MATLKSLMKTGFGLGLGVMAAQIVFIIIGAAFFIPGFILFTTQKNKKEKDTTQQISGIVLMGIGVLIMGGIGFSYFMDDLGSLFE
jgi:ABC-type Mn2+/Zn2+ transport system permease subunit